MPDLQQWPTKEQVRDRLNISARAVDRLVQRKKLRRSERRVFGRRPEPIFHPEDVELLAKSPAAVKGTDWLPVDSPDDGSRERAALSRDKHGLDSSLVAEQAIARTSGHGKTNPQLEALILELLQTIRAVSVSAPPLEIASPAHVAAPVAPALFLTMSEASLYSGLPEGRLRAFIKQGKLTRVPGAHGRTMIARGELENLWQSFASRAALDRGTEGDRS